MCKGEELGVGYGSAFARADVSREDGLTTVVSDPIIARSSNPSSPVYRTVSEE